MYRGGIETAIKEAVGFELLSRGIEVVLRLLLRGIETSIEVAISFEILSRDIKTAIKVYAENVFFLSFY